MDGVLADEEQLRARTAVYEIVSLLRLALHSWQKLKPARIQNVLAVLEERQRLARELHDAVTQALYGASLHAEAATRALAGGDLGPVGENLLEELHAPADRRATEITLTDRGWDEITRASSGHIDLVRRLFFEGLPDELLEPLTVGLEDVYQNVIERGTLPAPADES